MKPQTIQRQELSTDGFTDHVIGVRAKRARGILFRRNGWIAQLVQRLGSAQRALSNRLHRTRFGDPMLVFNMSIFNSAKSRECIFNSLPQRENVWL